MAGCFVVVVGKPDPTDSEQILEVATFPLEEALRRLMQTATAGPTMVKLLRLAAALRANAG